MSTVNATPTEPPAPTINERWQSDADSKPWQFSLCSVCKHKTAGLATCEAFPGGIPPTFLSSEEDHTHTFWDEPVTFEYISNSIPLAVAERIK